MNRGGAERGAPGRAAGPPPPRAAAHTPIAAATTAPPPARVRAAAPPPPPGTPPRDEQDRPFDGDGEAWVARRAGLGLIGTGRTPLAPVEAIHFARAAEPSRPLREALIVCGRFDGLFEEELRTLWRTATPIVLPDD